MFFSLSLHATNIMSSRGISCQKLIFFSCFNWVEYCANMIRYVLILYLFLNDWSFFLYKKNTYKVCDLTVIINEKWSLNSIKGVKALLLQSCLLQVLVKKMDFTMSTVDIYLVFLVADEENTA